MTEIVFELLRNRGCADYIGEPVSQIEHMLEAGQCALDKGYPDFVITAALLHDIGHLLPDQILMDDLGVKDHEIVGANYLHSLGFNDEVCDLVRNHVNAKRYLVTINEDYVLSEASARTLEYQGGRMSSAKLLEFKQRKNFDWYLKMRAIDELAKGDQISRLTLEDFRSICDRCCS